MLGSDKSAAAPKTPEELALHTSALLRVLEQSRYPEPVDAKGLQRGSITEFIKIVRFVFLGFSKYVHKSVTAAGLKFSTTSVDDFLAVTECALASEFGMMEKASDCSIALMFFPLASRFDCLKALPPNLGSMCADRWS